MKRIAISSHSQHDQLAGKICDALKASGHSLVTLNESRPQALKGREQTMKWCEVFIQVASTRYQREPFLLELSNYAKTLRKPIITALGQANYQPSGGLAAIAVAGLQTIDFTKTEKFGSSLELVKKEIEAVTLICTSPKPGLGNAKSLSKPPPTKSSGIFISYENDSKNMANIVAGALQSSQLTTTVKLGDPSKNNDQSITTCQVFIAILSSQYEDSTESQNNYELARIHRKAIIPVIGVNDYQPGKWLALAIAGKLYYYMPDRETAYKAFYDSSSINDLVYAVKAFLQPQPSEEEREKAEIQALEKQLEECKQKLSPWPPQPRPEIEETKKAMKDIKISDDQSNLVFNYIHHEVTRMSFVPPKPLFDARGVPVRRTFDVMCSYQWSIQEFVRDIYMDLHMRNLEVWMDIWGGMQGNINESMANAVESSAVIVCFLTEKYQQSVNCCLELKYAIKRNKPIVFIKVEPALSLLPWIAEIVKSSNIFEMSSIGDAGKKDNGVPRINRIAELLRAYSTSGNRKPVDDDVTEEVFARRDMLENALYWIHNNKGTSRYSKCGRCGAEFDENSSEGCKKHGSYYMGGTILAGRWVCCQQRDKNSAGCEKTKHTTTVLELKEIPSHPGCFKWS